MRSSETFPDVAACIKARFCKLRRTSQILAAPWKRGASARRNPDEIRRGLQPAMNNQLFQPAETIREFRRERAPRNRPETEVPAPAMNSQLLQPAEIIPKFRQLRGRATLQRRVTRRQDECGLQPVRAQRLSVSSTTGPTSAHGPTRESARNSPFPAQDADARHLH